MLLAVIILGLLLVVVLLALVINPPEALVKKVYGTDRKPRNPGGSS